MRYLTLLLLFATTGAMPCRADELPEADRLASAVEAVIEAVLDHHIEPPTRQQMVLALVKHLHHEDTPAQRAALSRTVSELGNKASIYAFMRKELDRYGERMGMSADRLETMDVSWLNDAVAGGVQLEDPKSIEVAEQLAANRYVGIGVQLSKHPEGFVFSNVMDNGTAARAGILSGDRLIKIDDHPLEEEIAAVIDQLRGPEGTSVRLTVQTNRKEPREVELHRRVVVMKTVELYPIESNSRTAFVSVDTIKASSIHEFQKVIDQLPKSIDTVQLRLGRAGNFHYFHLFVDALLEEGYLGELVTREGRQTIRTTPGNVLAGRKLKIELNDQMEQQKLLRYITARSDANVTNAGQFAIQPVYLPESFSIMDGQIQLMLASRRFQSGTNP